MKAYVITSGVVFGLVAAVHVWRAIEEGSHVLTDPWFLLATAVAAAFSLWAWRVLSRLPRS